MAREDFLKYAESYSGIDGGDIGAEYWFMGMEWSDIDDIKEHYYKAKNIWIEQKTLPQQEINLEEKKANEYVWKLERKIDELYKILPNKVSEKVIFQKNSNSLKLNLLPLPFERIDKHGANWREYEYTKKTGYSCFDEYIGKKPYIYENGIIPARQKLFQKLLQEGKRPKTIFCFGKDYEDDFIFALTGRRIKAREPAISLPTKHKLSGYNLKVEVYDVDSPEIKRIFVCPFPSAYTKTGYELYKLNDGDWEEIYKEVIK